MSIPSSPSSAQENPMQDPTGDSIASSLAQSAKRITRTLFSGQAIGSAVTVNIGTLGSIIAADFIGKSWAGVPSALYAVGGAFSAFALGTLMNRLGRRNTLMLGLLVGAFGGIVTTFAIIEGYIAFFIIGLIVMGCAKAALDLGRFVAGEVNTTQRRGRAVAWVVMGGTIGAVIGPYLNVPFSKASLALGLYQYTGIYAIIPVFFLIIAAIYFVYLKPEPRELAQAVGEHEDRDKPKQASVLRTNKEIFSDPQVITAMTAMVLGQVVMVMVMVITSLHMRSHAHSATNIAAVISSHTFGMFAFSVLTGQLLDRFGRAAVIIAGAAILMMAALCAPLSAHVIPLALFLFLLGLGWNFCFVGGSTLLSDSLNALERGRIQGINDLLIGLVSAMGSIVSGFVYAALGYAIMGITGGIVAMIPLLLTTWWWTTRRGARANSL